MSILDESKSLPRWEERNRRQNIIANVVDCVTKLFWDDRKEDEDLPRGSIEEAVKNGEISADEMVELFAARLKESL